MPMRVTICCKHFGSRGGAEKFLVCFAEHLRDAGHRVKVLAAKAEPGAEGIHVEPLSVRLGVGPFRDLALARASERALAAEDADVTFSDQKCLGAQVVRVGGGLHREYLRRQAETYRSPVAGAMFRLRAALSLRNRLRFRIEDRLYAHPDLRRVVANSDMVRDELAAHYPVVADRLRVVVNGVDPERFSPDLRAQHRERVRRELSIPEDALLGVFVGHGWRRKGLHTLVEALGELRRRGHEGVYGMVVGSGNRRAMERFASECGAEGRLRFAGAAAPEPYYGAADAAMLPSYYDPCANVTLEGLACGLPVLTAATNGCAQVLTHGEDGYVLEDAGDAQELAEHMEALLDPGRMAEMSAAARRKALEFTTEKQFAKLTSILEEAAEAG